MIALIEAGRTFQSKHDLLRSQARYLTPIAQSAETIDELRQCFDALATQLFTITDDELVAIQTLTSEDTRFALSQKKNDNSRQAMARMRARRGGTQRQEDKADEDAELANLDHFLAEVQNDLIKSCDKLNAPTQATDFNDLILTRTHDEVPTQFILDLLIATMRARPSDDSTWVPLNRDLSKKLTKRLYDQTKAAFDARVEPDPL